MNQIRFRLGLRPRPSWWSSQRSPDHLAEIRRKMGVRKDLWRGRGTGKGRKMGKGERK